MDKKIYTYTFFWMDANRDINIVKAKVEDTIREDYSGR